jgi:hypothetical protein
MRLLTLAIFIGVSGLVKGQYNSGYLPEFFFGRQANARAEALGRSYTSIDGDLGSIYFNPAGTATVKGIMVNTSYTPPGSTKGFYTFFALSHKLNKHFQLAISQFKFDFGKTQVANATRKPFTENITINISSQPIKDLLLGLNANYVVWQPGNTNSSKSIFFDFGVIKEIDLSHKTGSSQKIRAGASISNFNASSTTATLQNVTEKYHLPVITRFAISYDYEFGKAHLLDTVSAYKILLQTEYQTLLNSKYRSGIKFGGELKLLDLLSLRCGWYNEKVSDFGFPDDNKDQLSSWTYGVGFHIPFKQITKLPIDVQFDYTSLPQVNYSKHTTSLSNFSTYDFKVSYLLKSFK